MMKNDDIELYNFVKKHSMKIAGKFYSILTKEDFEDLVHDAYLKVRANTQHINEDGNPAGWNWRVCRNAVMSYIKAKSKRNELFGSYEEDYDDEDAIDLDRTSILGDTTYLPDRETLKKEFEEGLNSAIRKLNPESKEVVVHLMDETPYKKMADALECSEGALRVKIFRTRKELRKYGVAV